VALHFETGFLRSISWLVQIKHAILASLQMNPSISFLIFWLKRAPLAVHFFVQRGALKVRKLSENVQSARIESHHVGVTRYWNKKFVQFLTIKAKSLHECGNFDLFVQSFANRKFTFIFPRKRKGKNYTMNLWIFLSLFNLAHDPVELFFAKYGVLSVSFLGEKMGSCISDHKKGITGGKTMPQTIVWF